MTGFFNYQTSPVTHSLNGSHPFHCYHADLPFRLADFFAVKLAGTTVLDLEHAHSLAQTLREISFGFCALPPVELTGLEAVLLAELGHGLMLQEMEPEDLDFLFGTVLLTGLFHVATRGCE